MPKACPSGGWGGGGGHNNWFDRWGDADPGWFISGVEEEERKAYSTSRAVHLKYRIWHVASHMSLNSQANSDKQSAGWWKTQKG